MDLLERQWLHAKRIDGTVESLAALDIVHPQFVGLLMVRPDFQGAAYQLLIGLLQTTFTPQDRDEWHERLTTPPSSEELEKAFEPWRHAFLLENPDGPAFFQDLKLEDARSVSANELLFEFGSEPGKYFSKPKNAFGLCDRCAVLALITLQLNAPAGGRGTRTSLRGGGPLTTLVTPERDDASLWERVWLNVIPADELGYPPIGEQSDVLPWLAPTRRSDGPRALATTPEAVHPLQAYWSMSRRIRFDWSDAKPGACSICGEGALRLLSTYQTRYGGINYEGAWMHPLSPYTLDAKGEKPPIARKGQPGGVGYRDWLALTYGTDELHPAAAVVRNLVNSMPEDYALRLWASGGDFDNMKLRAWHDSMMPLYPVGQSAHGDFIREVGALIEAADATSKFLGDRVRQAWGTDKSDPAVRASLWEETEREFYDAVQRLSRIVESTPDEMVDILRAWLRALRDRSLRLFDRWAASAPIEGLDTKRMVEARGGLFRDLHRKAPLNRLWKHVRAMVEAT